MPEVNAAAIFSRRAEPKVHPSKGPRAYYQRHVDDPKKWVPIMAQIHDHTAHMAGISAKRFYSEATPYLDAQIAVQSYYNFDVIQVFNDVYNFEAEALGAKMIYGHDSMPTIDFREPLLKQPGDLSRLKTPDFRKDGRFPYQVDALRQTIEIGIDGAFMCAPFSLAVGLRSYPRLIHDIKKDPVFVRDLMTFLEDEVLLPYIRFLHQEYGFTLFSAADAWAAVPDLSPQMFEEQVIPWNLRLQQAAQQLGVTALVMAGADYCEERLEKVDPRVMRQSFEAAVKSFGGAPLIFMAMGRWQDYPLEPVLEYARELNSKGLPIPTVVMGALNARVLRDGPVSEIVRNVKRMIDTFAGEFPFGLFIANIPTDTPPEHVHAAVQATHYYGEMPYRFRDDGASFRPAPRESYAEFMSKLDTH